MPAYADLENLIADYLPEATKDEEAAALGRLLDNVSAFVDSYCRRNSGYFAPNDAETEIRVRGEGERFLRLPVHQLGTITEVKYRGSIVSSSDYYESDKNGWLYLEDDNSLPESTFDFCSNLRWYDGETYRVTLKFGYAETPKVIQEFCRLAVKSIWESQNGTLGQISPEGFALKAQLFPPDLLLMISEFRKREFEI